MNTKIESIENSYKFNTNLSLSERILLISTAIENYKNNIPFTFDNKEIDLLVRVSYFLLSKNKASLNNNMLASIVLLAFGNYAKKTEDEMIEIFSESFYSIKNENEKHAIVSASNLILQILKIMCPYCISQSNINEEKTENADTPQTLALQGKKATIN